MKLVNISFKYFVKNVYVDAVEWNIPEKAVKHETLRLILK